MGTTKFMALQWKTRVYIVYFVYYSDYVAVINRVVFYSAVQQNRNIHSVALAGMP